MPKLKVETQLARVFASVADSEQSLESTASGILAIVKDNKINTVDRWDEAVEAAYEANGWNKRAGRPANGEEPKLPVPTTVSSYVALVRTALRNKMKVYKYDTFTALRVAMAKRNGRADHRGGNGSIAPGGKLNLKGPVAESFIDVDIQKAEPNGALFHDLAVVYATLPAEHQSMLGRQLAKLLHKYLPLARVNGNGESHKQRKAAVAA
jgi:hypothetical protein